MLGLGRFVGLLGVFVLLCPTVSYAQHDDRFRGANEETAAARYEGGIALRFMPIGWFEIPDVAGRDFRAYPALGFALFVDRVLHRYFCVGISPEVTLNVFPNRADYSVGNMLTFAARLQAQYPGHVIEPYAVATGGYSLIWRDDGGRAWGPAVGASLGVRLRLSTRRALFGELGYQKGFQRADGSPYGPSYLIIGAGLRVGF